VKGCVVIALILEMVDADTCGKPWRIVYRHTPDDGDFKTNMASISSPNGHLQVTGPGLYEISSILDSQCPGTVDTEAANYTVEWVPRPSARLSPQSESVYIERNRSHVLPPVCEGTDDHIDLELTGQSSAFSCEFDVRSCRSRSSPLRDHVQCRTS
jgi:hypothetical protein